MLKNIIFSAASLAMAVALSACVGESSNRDALCVYCFSSDDSAVEPPTEQCDVISFMNLDNEFPIFNIHEFDAGDVTVVKEYAEQDAQFYAADNLLDRLVHNSGFTCAGDPASSCDAKAQKLSEVGVDGAVATFMYSDARAIRSFTLLFSGMASSDASLNADDSIELLFGSAGSPPRLISTIYNFDNTQRNVAQLAEYFQKAKQQFNPDECIEFSLTGDSFTGGTCDDTARAYCEALDKGSAIIHTVEVNKALSQFIFSRGLQWIDADEVPDSYVCQ